MKYFNDTNSEFEYVLRIDKELNEYYCHSRIEIIHVKKGNARLRCDMGETVYDLLSGDYAVIKNLDVHRIVPYDDFEGESIFFPVSYRNNFNLDYIKKSFIIPGGTMEKHIEENKLAKNVITLLAKKNLNESLLKNLCSSLCSLLLSLYPERRVVHSIGNDDLFLPDTLKKSVVSIETMERFDRVLEYINSNYTDKKLNLPVVANLFGFNSTYLSALFPKLVKQNFKEYVHNLKINYAIELLLTTEKNISEVAYNSGFETIRSFNNVFKNLVGTTPSGFLSANNGTKTEGIETEMQALGGKLFDYSWTSNVKLALNKQSQHLEIICNNVSLKLWCHLRIRMLFFAGKTYSISYKAKFIGNGYGNFSDSNPIKCDFYFFDSNNAVAHHPVDNIKQMMLEDGWVQLTAQYTVPDYYKPSTADLFSIYSEPYEDIGVSFVVKDVVVKIL